MLKNCAKNISDKKFSVKNAVPKNFVREIKIVVLIVDYIFKVNYLFYFFSTRGRELEKYRDSKCQIWSIMGYLLKIIIRL